jgi:hypothetical protein
MNFVAFAFFFGPLGKLLRPSAVVRHRALGVERQSLPVHVDFHALIARDDLRPARITFLRSFRMQWKLRELDLQSVVFFEFLDTPGDEIAPGSDKIGEYF